MKKLRKWKIACIMFLVLCGIAYYAIGSKLIAPAPANLGDPQLTFDVENVIIPSDSGSDLAAWIGPGHCGCGVVVLMHGIRGNRLSLVERAEMLHEAGFSVVMVDLQAHGESPGKHITFGHLERYDAIAAVAYARHRFPNEPIGVIGISLGGVATTLAASELEVDAVVLEAVYADIGSATENRLRMRVGPLASVFAPVLMLQLPLRTAVSISDLQPVKTIGSLKAPTLIVAGTEDLHSRPADTRKLFEATLSPKQMWWVKGAAHVDFYSFDEEGYQEQVLGFIQENLEMKGNSQSHEPTNG